MDGRDRESALVSVFTDCFGVMFEESRFALAQGAFALFATIAVGITLAVRHLLRRSRFRSC